MSHNHNHDEEQERIIIPDENGEEHLFDILFTFDVEETGKSYMVVQPAESPEDDEEEAEVFGFRYEDVDGEFSLFPIETDEEWDIVEEMLNTFVDEEEL
ncbi:uncharacterized protein YrzB (UPF0473 family) [Pullulanibacillus pueri]|uniref:UPF0473 protein GCM10007096_31690 n=1 Tax=Pullulanibacillus pueri TaxID=1437324 RepID=A0A8J3EMT4_9BACL|nr:DUF1292 domain-containing protein [Pullulanibacillus pueri]MBM7683240.1 uncharacterized protein YrzB (UPF0473 family) [Pullulanibacillus pueri]GGH85699.1 UPF0473 protein [Pullulanibacillus pueri]